MIITDTGMAIAETTDVTAGAVIMDMDTVIAHTVADAVLTDMVIACLGSHRRSSLPPSATPADYVRHGHSRH
jgi:hypothetical protein